MLIIVGPMFSSASPVIVGANFYAHLVVLWTVFFAVCYSYFRPLLSLALCIEQANA